MRIVACFVGVFWLGRRLGRCSRNSATKSTIPANASSARLMRSTGGWAATASERWQRTINTWANKTNIFMTSTPFLATTGHREESVPGRRQGAARLSGGRQLRQVVDGKIPLLETNDREIWIGALSPFDNRTCGWRIRDVVSLDLSDPGTHPMILR